MPKIPTVYEGDEDEIGTTTSSGLSNEVVESLAQNYFDFKNKEIELAERLMLAFLDTVKFGMEAIREENRLDRNYRAQSDKREYDFKEQQARRDHEKWAASQREPAKDEPKVSKAALAAKSCKSTVRKTKGRS